MILLMAGFSHPLPRSVFDSSTTPWTRPFVLAFKSSKSHCVMMASVRLSRLVPWRRENLSTLLLRPSYGELLFFPAVHFNNGTWLKKWRFVLRTVPSTLRSLQPEHLHQTLRVEWHVEGAAASLGPGKSLQVPFNHPFKLTLSLLSSKSTFSQPFIEKCIRDVVRIGSIKPRSSYCVMLYFWWGYRRNLTLFTLTSERAFKQCTGHFKSSPTYHIYSWLVHFIDSNNYRNWNTKSRRTPLHVTLVNHLVTSIKQQQRVELNSPYLRNDNLQT